MGSRAVNLRMVNRCRCRNACSPSVRLLGEVFALYLESSKVGTEEEGYGIADMGGLNK